MNSYSISSSYKNGLALDFGAEQIEQVILIPHDNIHVANPETTLIATSNASVPKLCSIIVSSSCFDEPVTTAFKQPSRLSCISSRTPLNYSGICFISKMICFFFVPIFCATISNSVFSGCH